MVAHPAFLRAAMMLSAMVPRLHAQAPPPPFAESQAEWGAAFGWKPLHGTMHPGGLRELRVWVGFGIFAPEYAVRIVSRSGRVSGEQVYHWYPVVDSAQEAAADRDSMLVSIRELRASLRQAVGCRDFRQAKEVEFCRATLAPGQSWRSLLSALDSLGIGALPDAAALNPPGPVGFDGVTMVVEVRDGDAYRAYSYWTPRDDAPQPEVRRAAQILDRLGRIGIRDHGRF